MFEIFICKTRKAMSHFLGDRSNFLYKLLKQVNVDRNFEYDYRIKTPTTEKPPMFRYEDGFVQSDFRHEVLITDDSDQFVNRFILIISLIFV